MGTQKNRKLMHRLVGMTKGVVLGPFAGSGSTLIAGRELGRQAQRSPDRRRMSTQRRRQSGALRRFRKQFVAVTRDAEAPPGVETRRGVIQPSQHKEIQQP